MQRSLIILNNNLSFVKVFYKCITLFNNGDIKKISSIVYHSSCICLNHSYQNSLSLTKHYLFLCLLIFFVPILKYMHDQVTVGILVEFYSENDCNYEKKEVIFNMGIILKSNLFVVGILVLSVLF